VGLDAGVHPERMKCSGSIDSPLVILSPHLDDAVLSCWHLLDGPDDVRVVNVFAGKPPRDAAAGWWDELSGRHDSGQAVDERVAEDRAALALAGREPLNLDFLDRQYTRCDQPLAPVVRALRAALAPGAVVLAPCALGPALYAPIARKARAEPHPDHVAVRSAALALRSEGLAVALYADFPHAGACGLPAWVTGEENDASADQNDASADPWAATLATIGLPHDQFVGEVCRLTPPAFARKLKAARRYATQIAALERAFAKRLDDLALLGYEVVWRLPETIHPA
jgi:LmbE family N-acetylglucosaminyl deacetylase